MKIIPQRKLYFFFLNILLICYLHVISSMNYLNLGQEISFSKGVPIHLFDALIIIHLSLPKAVMYI